MCGRDTVALTARSRLQWPPTYSASYWGLGAQGLIVRWDFLKENDETCDDCEDSGLVVRV